MTILAVGPESGPLAERERRAAVNVQVSRRLAVREAGVVAAAPRRRLTVIIPCYNEAATVLQLLARVQALPLDKRILVIDNCSTDGTRELLASLPGRPVTDSERSRFRRATALIHDQRIVQSGDVTVVLQPKTYDKSQSLRIGIALADSDYVVCQDADLEYDPSDILRLLDHAERTQRAAVFGSRLCGHIEIARNAFHLGRVGLTKLFRCLYGGAITDVATCYKLMRTDVAQSLDLRSSGFNLDFEIPAELRRRGHSIDELPVSYFPRSCEQGKKIRWRDGLSAASTLIGCRFRGASAARRGGTAALCPPRPTP